MGASVVVTGGVGYIGSHTVLQLLLGGYSAVVVDNSSDIALDRVRKLAGEFGKNLGFHRIDLRDKGALEKIFATTKFYAVIHFAGLKAVGECAETIALLQQQSYRHNYTAGSYKIPLVMSGRRPRDAETVYASTSKAERELSWKAKYGIKEMCRDQWNWASKNPYGFESPDSTDI